MAEVIASLAGSDPLRLGGRIDLPYSRVKSGVDATFVRRLEAARILGREDLRLLIADRTLDRRIARREPLKPEEIEGILRLLRVLAHAVRVFDDPEVAEEWLRLPNPSLADEVPMDRAATDLGAREVEAVLTRIEHGVFA
jgi:putative toxin-antitoxin system antitoxin component (TIGR02293 family)